jgi:hypothetical protein
MPPILVILVVISGFHLRRSQAASNQRRAWLPLAINVGTLLTVATGFTMQIERTYDEFKFQRNQNSYQEIVRLVGEGRIRSNPDSFALLPQEYQFLSECGGEIMIDTSGGVTRVFFFTYRDMFDDFAGYEYRSDNQPPQRDDFSERPNALRGCGLIEQKRPFWFYCHHT